jgi:hypothetical protein
MQWLRSSAGLAVVAGVSTALAFTRGPSPAWAPEAAIGSWRLVSAKANGKLSDFPAGTTILKHVTPTDFMFVYYNTQGLITVAGGGKYSLEGTHYEEAVQYGIGEGMAPLIGTTQVFTLRIEGGRWHQTGKETDGTLIEEVWERVRPMGARH